MKNVEKWNKKTYLIIKRTMDIVIGAIGVIVMIPIGIVIKIAYVIEGDRDSIFYSQKRLGERGREFKIYKFKSMVPNAEEKLKEILKEDKELREEYRLNRKLKVDPRITKIGKILRKTSLDEFPQFVNVLKGDMSVVGNRPYLPEEREEMGEYGEKILKSKCGIISYWSIKGRSEETFEKRLELEKYYAENQSLSMDIKIFIKAIWVVLSMRGAR